MLGCQTDGNLTYAAEGNNVVLLDPDIAKAFPNDAAVNEANKGSLKLNNRHFFSIIGLCVRYFELPITMDLEFKRTFEKLYQDYIETIEEPDEDEDLRNIYEVFKYESSTFLLSAIREAIENFDKKGILEEMATNTEIFDDIGFERFRRIYLDR